MNTSICTALILGSMVAVGTLAGCGGGGGGGTENPSARDPFVPPAISTEPIAITTTNAADAVLSTTGMTRQAVLTTVQNTPMGAEISPDITGNVNPLQILSAQIRRALKRSPEAGTVPNGIQVTTSEPCVSGSESYVFNVAHAGAAAMPATANFEIGDSLLTTFNACGLFEGGTLSGNITVTATSSFMPDCTGDCVGSLSVDVDNVVLTWSTGSYIIDGSFDLAWEDSADTYSTTLSNGALYFVRETDGILINAVHISNLSSSTSGTSSADGSSSHFVLTGTVAIVSGTVNGQVDISIDASFTYVIAPTTYTQSGTVTVTGANSSSVRATLNGIFATVAVDADGNGTYESPVENINLGYLTN